MKLEVASVVVKSSVSDMINGVFLSHVFLVVAQIGEEEKRTDVIDLWSEDTKHDSWFSQSAMDVGFRWLEQELPGYHVYLFSGEWL